MYYNTTLHTYRYISKLVIHLIHVSEDLLQVTRLGIAVGLCLRRHGRIYSIYERVEITDIGEQGPTIDRNGEQNGRV